MIQRASLNAAFGCCVLVLALLLSTSSLAQQAPAGSSNGSPSSLALSASSEQLSSLRAILSRPEFQLAESKGLFDSLLDRLRTVLRALLLELLRLFVRLTSGEDAATYAFLGAAVLVAAGAGLVVFRLSRGGVVAEATAGSVNPVGEPRAEDELALGRSLAQAGDLRGAVHHRYLAALRRLDERGTLRFDRTMTNREHLLRATAQPAIAQVMTPLVTMFDSLWYGQSSCSREEYDRFSALADQVWQAAG